MLKTVSRSRSEVGRTASDDGPLRARPRKRPPTILMLRLSPAAVARRSFRAGAFRAGSARAGAGTGRTRPLAETAAPRAFIPIPPRSLVAGRATRPLRADAIVAAAREVVAARSAPWSIAPRFPRRPLAVGLRFAHQPLDH